MYTIGLFQTNEQEFFETVEQDVIKAVERVFIVLFEHYQILYKSCRLWYLINMTNIVKTCYVVHNMACEECRESLNRSRVVRMRLNEIEHPDTKAFVTFLTCPQDEGARNAFRNVLLARFKDIACYHAL